MPEPMKIVRSISPTVLTSMVLLAVSLMACAPAGQKMSLAEFNELKRSKDAEGSFVIEGTVRSYGVEHRGGVVRGIKTKDGRKMHFLQLTAADGKRATVWLDSKRVKLPKGGNVVRVTGQFDSLLVIARHGAPSTRTIGLARKVRVLQK